MKEHPELRQGFDWPRGSRHSLGPALGPPDWDKSTRTSLNPRQIPVFGETVTSRDTSLLALLSQSPFRSCHLQSFPLTQLLPLRLFLPLPKGRFPPESISSAISVEVSGKVGIWVIPNRGLILRDVPSRPQGWQWAGMGMGGLWCLRSTLNSLLSAGSSLRLGLAPLRPAGVLDAGPSSKCSISQGLGCQDTAHMEWGRVWGTGRSP